MIHALSRQFEGARAEEVFLMPHNRYREKTGSLLSRADIRLNGARPWDIRVHTEDFYPRLFAHGTLGLGESYMDGWWECDAIDEFVNRAYRSDLVSLISSPKEIFDVVKAKITNCQKISRAYQVGECHYDIGNDLFQRMLDRRMIYSCAYWESASCLDEAQEAKLDLVCRKLYLKPGMEVLDIGCGWGGMARFAAQNYGVSVTGITVSKEQAQLATAKSNGLPVTIRFQDYRTLDGHFDRILSLGMFEHVGYKNYRTFMRTARRLLKDNGLLLLHTIGNNRSVTGTDPWIERYIFPNSVIPSAKQITKAFEGLFVLEDWHNFGVDYDKTLMEWFHNFEASWPELQDKYDERFYRMWKFYLLSCAGTFRARKKQLWQIVLSPAGVPSGYHAVR